MSAARRRHYIDRRLNRRGWRQRSAENEKESCVAPGCGWRRKALGRYCEDHRRNLERTGHPLVGRSIPQDEWKPFVEAASAFVSAQLATEPPHPSIVAAVSWASEELTRAHARQGEARRRGTEQAGVEYASRLRRVSSRGLDGRELLARLIAAYLIDDRGHADRPRFKDNDHFAHQAARLLLHRARIGRLAWRRQAAFDLREAPIHAYHDPNIRTRRYAFHRLNGAIGVVARAAADALRAQTQNTNQSTTTAKDTPS